MTNDTKNTKASQEYIQSAREERFVYAMLHMPLSQADAEVFRVIDMMTANIQAELERDWS